MHQLFRLILFIFFLTCVVHRGFSQGYAILGYGAGISKPQDINRLLYLSNTTNDMDKDMSKIRFNRGISIGYGYLDEIGFEVKYHQRRGQSVGKYTDAGISYTRDLKIKSNTWSLNLFYHSDDGFEIGFGSDFGQFKGWGRTYEEDQEVPSYDLLFAKRERSSKSADNLKSSTAGLSPFIGCALGDFIAIRLTYFFRIGSGVPTQQLSDFLNLNDFGDILGVEDQMNGLSLEIHFRLGKW